MGCDFAFENAGQNFKRMEGLITEIKKLKLPFEIKFSTPIEYVRELKKESIKYPVFTGDLEPFSESNNEVYSGFFSSKPSLKK